MSNDMVGPADLVDFGSFTDPLVDAAVASIRRDADWHICPRITETITLKARGGVTDEIALPTRDFREAPVLVTAVQVSGQPVTGWVAAEGLLILRGHHQHYRGWRGAGDIVVTLTHGFAACPPDLLPVIAQRAAAARSPRDPRTSSFSNGVVQMAFRAGGQLDPTVAQYAVIGGVA